MRFRMELRFWGWFITQVVRLRIGCEWIEPRIMARMVSLAERARR